MEVIIDGVRYVPAEVQPDEVNFYYMHDIHIFSRLYGATIDEVLAAADAMAAESRCGMLCPPVLLSEGKELRRLREVAHAPCCGSDDSKWQDGKARWRIECETDADVVRLVSSNDRVQGEPASAGVGPGTRC